MDHKLSSGNGQIHLIQDGIIWHQKVSSPIINNNQGHK